MTDIVEQRAGAARSLRAYAETWDNRHKDIAADFRAGADALDLIEKHRAAVEVLREALEPFAMCPVVGKDGGKFIIASAQYADRVTSPRAAYWHMDQFDKARKALASIGDVT